MFSIGILTPNLVAFENKSHQAYVLDLQAKKTFQHIGNTSAMTLSSISTLIQSLFLNTQIMKVVKIFIGVSYNFDSSK